MQIHELKTSKRKRKAKKGRGIGSKGCKCGRGQKGQRARAGARIRPTFEGGQTPLFRLIPKVRGKKRNQSIQEKAIVFNLSDLSRMFKTGEIVSPSSLYKKGYIRSSKKEVKILAKGDIKHKLTLKGVKASGEAKKMIEESGGSFEESRKQEIKKPRNQETKKSRNQEGKAG